MDAIGANYEINEAKCFMQPGYFCLLRNDIDLVIKKHQVKLIHINLSRILNIPFELQRELQDNAIRKGVRVIWE